MAKFFAYFPRTVYSLEKNDIKVITNLTARFCFDETIKNNTSSYYDYVIRDGDTPEIIASKYYNDPEKHWVVLMFNNIINPNFDWPLPYESLMDFIELKYKENGGLSWAMNVSNIHSYYKIVKRSSVEGVDDEVIFQISQDEYANTPASTIDYILQDGTILTEVITTKFKTYFDYEVELNESKRNIKLLKSEYIPRIDKEFRALMKL